MEKNFKYDLRRLKSRAFYRAEWAEDALRRYHEIADLKESDAAQLRRVYEWMFVPPTLWPFNVQDVLVDCLDGLQKARRLNSRQRLLIDLLPEPPDETVCDAIANHELQVQRRLRKSAQNAIEV